jgi:hypothetical protein
MPKYRLYKNTNVKSAGYNKYYASRKCEKLIETDEIIRRLAARYVTFAPGEVHGMVMTLTEIIKELAFMGHGVKLNDLGIFWVGCKSKGVTDPTKFNAKTDIASRWRCRPTGDTMGKVLPVTRSGGVGIEWTEDEDYTSPARNTPEP